MGRRLRAKCGAVASQRHFSRTPTRSAGSEHGRGTRRLCCVSVRAVHGKRTRPPGAICNVPSPLKTPPERMAFPTKDWEATASGDANGFTHAASRYPQREGLQQLEGGETASPRGSRGTAFSGLPCSRLRPPPCITRRRGKLRVMQTVPRDFGIRGRNASSLRKGSGVEVLCSRDQRWRLASLVSRSRQSSGLSKTST